MYTWHNLKVTFQCSWDEKVTINPNITYGHSITLAFDVEIQSEITPQPPGGQEETQFIWYSICDLITWGDESNVRT